MDVGERLQIEALWRAGQEIPQIAVLTGRHRSTVWRELQRNHSYRHGHKNPAGRSTARPAGRGGLYRWGYLAGRAQERAAARARRPKPAKLGPGTALRAEVLQRLRQRHSPRQIAHGLPREHPGAAGWAVSHETIYQAIYVQGRGSLRAELADQVALRSGRAHRRARRIPGGAVRSARAWATPQFHLSARPAEAADRAVPGHWEGDLVIGARGASAIVTLVERSTRYVMLGALPGGRASEAVIDVLSTLAQRLPQHLLRSLAWDLGPELAGHAGFTVATGCPVFFCDPHSPWQRGSNENTNGLLRQYFPRSTTDLRTWTQEALDDVAAELNGRPRETLGWHTPAEKLNELLVATAA
ncbi:IS30 family transposase [Geodermatophilus sp. DSM 44513]|nr:IS30 family transposase [Geodermatophilus sp. DSM 44513]WNV77458.1 IS30 family transposase [Geodermatophilus sp. DSM 44513]